MSERDDDDLEDDRAPPPPTPSLLAEASTEALDEVLRRNVDGLVRSVTGPAQRADPRPLPHRLLTRGLAALGAVAELERRQRAPASEGYDLGSALARVGRVVSAAAAARGQQALARAFTPLPELRLEVAQLRAQLLDWNGREVRVAGYPMTFFDPGRLGSTVKLHVSDVIDSTCPALVQGTLVAHDPTPLRRSDVIVVHGRISDAVLGYVELTGCSRVQTLDALPEASSSVLTPEALDPSQILRADVLHAVARGLVGQELVVRGRVEACVQKESGGWTLELLDVEHAVPGATVTAALAAAPSPSLAAPGRVVLLRARVQGGRACDPLLSDAEIVGSDE